MTWQTITDAFENIFGGTVGEEEVTGIMGAAMDVITSNAGLLTLFCAGMIPIGFRIFKRAKRAVR